ncbi:hypothetical protein GCM10023350_43400 [Nocardioides endophyticus]|uniref:Uncharacterized protein n=1 Tax=Nocardioides endophyticus TaxID=1353775 RepID=A0ABP8ZDF5_9ACTN
MTTTPDEQSIEDPDISPGVTPDPVNPGEDPGMDPVDPGAGDEPDVRPSSDPF